MRKSNGYVVQWKNYKWVNFYDEDGYTRHFDTIEEAKAFEAERHFNRKVERRICWHNGGRTYTLVEELGERYYTSHRYQDKMSKSETERRTENGEN